ncbi:TraL conjugative transposon family protein [Xylanibacter rodentium]|uniref:TraL conjugative transposon family protein n=1 Tax=Xylanibacter rodentium TaxID=2736289 RepID=UPI00258B15CF|nr:TraL conjugative transposon family protein [Xylanibacter rodentium]
MNLFSKSRAARDAIYNMVWRNPKGRLSAKLRKRCDKLPHNQRLTVIAVMLTACVLIAFFVFGHACYRIGLGHSRQSLEVEHIRSLELPTLENDVQTVIPTAYDDAGMESED